MTGRSTSFTVLSILCVGLHAATSALSAEAQTPDSRSSLAFTLFNPRYLAFSYIEERITSPYPMRIVRLWKRGDGQGEGEEIVSIPSHEAGGIVFSTTRWLMSASRWTEIASCLESNRLWKESSVALQDPGGTEYMDGVSVCFFRYQAGIVVTSKDVKRRIRPADQDGTSSQAMIRLFYAAIPEESETLPEGILMADWRYSDENGAIVRSKRAGQRVQ